MPALKHRIMGLCAVFLLTACASGTETVTVGGARTVFSDPVSVDIVEAQFNIPSLIPRVDGVRRSLRDNGAVVVETYYVGSAPVVIVEHAGDAWFSDITLANAIDEKAFRAFLSRTSMRDGSPVISKIPGDRLRGFVAHDGACIAFHFFKRVKDTTTYDNDTQNPDTFIVGFACDVDSDRFVERFGFMSADDAARIGKRHSI